MGEIFSVFLILFSSSIFAQQANWQDVEQALGKSGTIQGEVFKVTFPRSDLNVKVDDFTVSPGLALTSWIGFITGKSHNMSSETMMMGDLVLLEDEVASVIAALVSENLQVTAIHNHILGEKPAIKYVHFSGIGEGVKLAESIKRVISTTGTPESVPPQAQQSSLDWGNVEAILGESGKKSGNLLQFSFPRKEILKDSRDGDAA